jgi:hypothetical protein
MNTIPAVLIPIVQAVLASQGYPASIVKQDGTFDFALLASSTYNSATFWTEYTPQFSVDITDALAPGPPNPLLELMKPTIVLQGPAGQKVIAPYGVATVSAGLEGPFILGVLGFGIFMLGRLSR